MTSRKLLELTFSVGEVIMITTSEWSNRSLAR